MSDAALAWAWRQKTGSMAAQIVLVRLADSANENGTCHPSQESLARECQTTRQTVNRQIRRLKELGLLEVVHRSNGKQQFSNVYQLRLDVHVTVPEKVEKPKPVPKPEPEPEPETEPVVLEPVRQLSIIEITGGEIQAEKPKPKKKQVAKKASLSAFDTFWAAYPRKTGKAEAKLVWERINPDAELLQTMLEAIEDQKRSQQWQNKKYIMEPRRWLLRERWTDEVTEYAEEYESSIVDPFADYQPTEEQIRIATEGIVPCPKCRGANDINMTDTCIYCRTPLQEQAQARSRARHE